MLLVNLRKIRKRCVQERTHISKYNQSASAKIFPSKENTNMEGKQSVHPPARYRRHLLVKQSRSSSTNGKARKDKKEKREHRRRKESKKSKKKKVSSKERKKKDRDAVGGDRGVGVLSARRMTGAVDQNEFGKWGVLKESDYFGKQGEFEVCVCVVLSISLL